VWAGCAAVSGGASSGRRWRHLGSAGAQRTRPERLRTLWCSKACASACAALGCNAITSTPQVPLSAGAPDRHAGPTGRAASAPRNGFPCVQPCAVHQPARRFVHRDQVRVVPEEVQSSHGEWEERRALCSMQTGGRAARMPPQRNPEEVSDVGRGLEGHVRPPWRAIWRGCGTTLPRALIRTTGVVFRSDGYFQPVAKGSAARRRGAGITGYVKPLQRRWPLGH
jgi:hypothetical protein